MAGNPGIDRRVEIDALTVKFLLTLNGGGVVALLAFVPTIIELPRYQHLLDAAFAGMSVFVFGLALVVIHNIARRKCELHHDHHNNSPPKGRVLGIPLWESGICAISTVCKWASLCLFMTGALLVAVTGICGESLMECAAGVVNRSSLTMPSP